MFKRLWYPQLDIFDCIRRKGALLRNYRMPTEIERLFISDFYLANPPLLHYTRMTTNTRNSFKNLNINSTKDSFLIYPAPQLLYKKMESVQREALRVMEGKEILTFGYSQKGLVSLTEKGISLFKQIGLDISTESENQLINFLTIEFAPLDNTELDDLRRKTSLRRGRW